MDDRLAKIEAGLERLVPRGISDTGRATLEARIDELAEGIDDVRHPHTAWKGGAAAAAAVAMLAGVALWQQHQGPENSPVAGIAPDLPAGPELVAVAVQVNSRFDGGWVHGDGSQRPFRYHGFDVTDETEMVDTETGYEVRVLEHREEWIPVSLSSL